MITSCKFTGICYFLAFNKESAVYKEQVNILQLGSMFVWPFPLWPLPAAWRGPRGRSWRPPERTGTGPVCRAGAPRRWSRSCAWLCTTLQCTAAQTENKIKIALYRKSYPYIFTKDSPLIAIVMGWLLMLRVYLWKFHVNSWKFPIILWKFVFIHKSFTLYSKYHAFICNLRIYSWKLHVHLQNFNIILQILNLFSTVMQCICKNLLIYSYENELNGLKM